jgi:hypothetical protein
MENFNFEKKKNLPLTINRTRFTEIYLKRWATHVVATRNSIVKGDYNNYKHNPFFKIRG